MWTGYAPFFLARDLDYLDPSRVRLVEYSSSSEAIRALRNNAIEAAALTLDEAIMLRDTGIDSRVVLVIDISNGADVVLGRGEVKTLSDLKGRRVGAESNALGAFVLSRALAKAGLSPADVIDVPLLFSEHERAFLEERVDAVVTFEPARTKLLKAGAHLLFDSTEMPGEIVDVLAVRADYLRGHENQITELLRAWFRGLDYLIQNPGDAAHRNAHRFGLSEKEFLKSLEGMHHPSLTEDQRIIGGTEPPLARTARLLSDVMLRENLISKRGDPGSIIDGALVERIAP